MFAETLKLLRRIRICVVKRSRNVVNFYPFCFGFLRFPNKCATDCGLTVDSVSHHQLHAYLDQLDYDRKISCLQILNIWVFKIKRFQCTVDWLWVFTHSTCATCTTCGHRIFKLVCVTDLSSSKYIHKIWKWIIRWKNRNILHIQEKHIYTYLYVKSSSQKRRFITGVNKTIGALWNTSLSFHITWLSPINVI